MKRWFKYLILWFSVALFPRDVLAVELVLALDRSGSMKANDPHRDSVRGVELFSDLLKPEDSLAFLAFAEKAEPLLPMTPLTVPKARERMAELASRIKMNGSLTNIEAALRQAHEELSRSNHNPLSERIVVLFTDGEIDLGDAAANQTALSSITSELVPKFKADGIRLYGVAFSAKADLELLRGLSEATGGQAFRVEQPSDVYKFFVRLFEETDQPLVAPIQDGRVTVDENVSELKLLVSRNSDEDSISMKDPHGVPIREGDQHPGVEWQHSPQFDRITIHQPDPGSWSVEGPNGDQKAYIASDLDLVAKLPALARIGESVSVSAQLTYQGQAVTDAAMLKNVAFKARILSESGATAELHEVAAQGLPEARGTLSFAELGTHQVRISAEHPGYQRSKILSISIIPSQVSGNGDSEEAPPVADRKKRTEKSRFGAAAKLIWVNLILLGALGIVAVLWRLLLRRRAAATSNKNPRKHLFDRCKPL